MLDAARTNLCAAVRSSGPGITKRSIHLSRCTPAKKMNHPLLVVANITWFPWFTNCERARSSLLPRWRSAERFRFAILSGTFVRALTVFSLFFRLLVARIVLELVFLSRSRFSSTGCCELVRPTRLRGSLLEPVKVFGILHLRLETCNTNQHTRMKERVFGEKRNSSVWTVCLLLQACARAEPGKGRGKFISNRESFWNFRIYKITRDGEICIWSILLIYFFFFHS